GGRRSRAAANRAGANAVGGDRSHQHAPSPTARRPAPRAAAESRFAPSAAGLEFSLANGTAAAARFDGTGAARPVAAGGARIGPQELPSGRGRVWPVRHVLAAGQYTRTFAGLGRRGDQFAGLSRALASGALRG